MRKCASYLVHGAKASLPYFIDRAKISCGPCHIIVSENPYLFRTWNIQRNLAEFLHKERQKKPLYELFKTCESPIPLLLLTPVCREAFFLLNMKEKQVIIVRSNYCTPLFVLTVDFDEQRRSCKMRHITKGYIFFYFRSRKSPSKQNHPKYTNDKTQSFLCEA